MSLVLLPLGPKMDDKPARQFICTVYLSQNPDPDRMCYSHFTAATGPSRTRLSPSLPS